MITRLLGIAIFGGSLAVVFMFEGLSNADGVMRLFHWPAMVLTGAGPIGLVLICFDGQVLLRTMRTVFLLSAKTLQRRHEREAIVLHRLGRDYYSEGATVFEKVKVRGISDYLKKVIERLSVRMPTVDIRELLQLERDLAQTRFIQSSKITSLGIRLAPSMGMLGTILGMVRLLESLQDPSRIGSQMSLALLTTFYGLFFSLILWTPLEQKIERVMDVELEGYDQCIRWLELLEKRKPVAYFADSAEIPDHETDEDKTEEHREPQAA